MSNQKLKELKKEIAPYEKSDLRSSVIQLINTLLPFFLLWTAAYLSLSVSYWLTLSLSIIASGFIVRIFIIFHDCCHQSFFQNRRWNDLVGTITGIITLFPYEKWKRDHSIHHATSSNLNKRGTGDIWIMTVNEYLSASTWERMQYRIYRNPFVMFFLGPFYLFLISNRMNRKGAPKKERFNTYLTNISILIIYALLCWAIGWQEFLLIQLPMLFVAGVLGIWLFYIQHTFEDSYFEEEENWDYVKAAIDGSSYYKLPKVLQWITGNIGFHHVHHLSPKVPNYHLETVHNQTEELQKATTVTIRSSFKALRFRLWDENKKRFVNFKDIKTLLHERKTEFHSM